MLLIIILPGEKQLRVIVKKENETDGKPKKRGRPRYINILNKSVQSSAFSNFCLLLFCYEISVDGISVNDAHFKKVLRIESDLNFTRL